MGQQDNIFFCGGFSLYTILSINYVPSFLNVYIYMYAQAQLCLSSTAQWVVLV